VVRIALTATITIFILSLGLFCKVCLRPLWKDLPRDEPFNVFLLLENTRYSEAYSESAFSRIREGMTIEEVIRLMGEPLEIMERSNGRIVRVKEKVDGFWRISSSAAWGDVDTIFYSYSLPGDSEHWFVRTVTFSSDGIVIGVEKSFYVD
jgi:hypothetical protein